MPFTPFHFGPGLVFNAAAPRQANWLTFCVANIIIDLEPAYYILTLYREMNPFCHLARGIRCWGEFRFQ